VDAVRGHAGATSTVPGPLRRPCLAAHNSLSSSLMLAHVRHDVSLAPLTTLGVGGPARRFAEPLTVAELVELVRWAESEEAPLLVLGGGSNVVVADAGFDGLVVSPALYRTEFEHLSEDHVRVLVGAGVEWDELVDHCVQDGLRGLECLSGIPGRVGAAPIQNIGAYGAEVGDVLEWVEALDRRLGVVVRLPAALCGLGYRDSMFKREGRDRYVVTGVALRLRRGGDIAIRYDELRRALGMDDESSAPSAADVRRTVLALRRRKSMVWDTDDPNHRSAGSFFMNPIVSEAEADRVGATVEGPMPRFAAPGGVKLAAGWLIEQAGFSRGLVRGAVGLSTRHALAIVNCGGASADDIVALARELREVVRARFGVTLEPEPVFVGFARAGGALLEDG
jgi:UDP-N-acetylmuramate dehydrogenase